MCNNRVVGYDETSVILQVYLQSSAGAALAGVPEDLSISLLRVGEAASAIKVFAMSSSNIETVSTIGTYAAPSSSSKCRISKVHVTDIPGWFEVHFHDSVFASTNGVRSVSVVFSASGMRTEALSIQLRPHTADLTRVNGVANAEATLAIKKMEITGSNSGVPSLLIKNTNTAAGSEALRVEAANPGNPAMVALNTSATANSHALKIAAAAGSVVVLDSASNGYAGLAFANNSAAAITGGTLALPASAVARTSWTFADWIAVTTRYVANKMVISKTAASMELYDDAGAAWKMQTITDDGTTQVRNALP